MKISEKQLQILFIIANDSLKRDILGVFSISLDNRINLISQIINQQSEKLIDIKEKENMVNADN